MSETTDRALLPCPFCNSSSIDTIQVIGFSARCRSCFATGPDRKTQTEAIEAWNRRAPKESRKLKEAMELLKGAEYFVRNFSGVTGPGKPYGDKCLCKYGHESCEFHRRYEALRNEQGSERDFTPEEALEEARKRWPGSGKVLVDGSSMCPLMYRVGILVADKSGIGFQSLGLGASFREAFAIADKKEAL